MIGRILKKARQDKKELVLIAPMWKSQVLLLNNLMDIPLFLPNTCDLILNPAGESHSLIQQDRLHLAARKFRKGFRSCILGMQERDTEVVSVSVEQME